MNGVTNWLKAFFVIAFLAVAGAVFADWEPPQFPPPRCDSGDRGCDMPLNVSLSPQVKDGGLAVGFLGGGFAVGSDTVNRLFVQPQSDGGNVGIGTTGPGSKLSVFGGVSVGSIYSARAAPASGMIVQGNVGLGTADPGAYRLDVAGDANATRLCIGGDCRGAWPVSGGGDGFWAGRAGFGGSEDIYNINVGNVGIGTGGTGSAAGKLSVGGGVSVGSSHALLKVPPSDGMTVQGKVEIAVPPGTCQGPACSPGEETMFDVNGRVRIRGGAPGQGKVLTAVNQNGEARWQTAPELAPGTPGQTLRYFDDGRSGGWVANSLIFNNGSRVGIGTTNPGLETILDVAGIVFLRGSPAGPGLFVDRTGNVGIGTTEPGAASRLRVSGGATVGYSPSAVPPFNGMIVQERVGIGTDQPDPNAKLDVNGQIKIRGGAPADNKVLVSDAGGLAAWKSLTDFGLLGGSSGQTLRHDGVRWVANSFLFNTGSALGVGTSLPQSRLHAHSTTAGSATSLLLTNLESGSGGADGLKAQLDGNGNAFLWNYESGVLQIGTNNRSVITVAPRSSDETVETVGIGAASLDVKLNVVVPSSDTVTNLLSVKRGTSRYLQILNNGNVGIATSTPQAKLDVAGDVFLRGSRFQTGLYVDGGGNVGIKTVTPEVTLDVAGAAHLRGAADQVGLYVAPSGNVGIGTRQTDSKLKVEGDTEASRFCLNGDCRPAWLNTGSFSLNFSVTPGAGWVELFCTAGDLGFDRLAFVVPSVGGFRTGSSGGSEITSTFTQMDEDAFNLIIRENNMISVQANIFAVGLGRLTPNPGRCSCVVFAESDGSSSPCTLGASGPGIPL